MRILADENIVETMRKWSIPFAIIAILRVEM